MKYYNAPSLVMCLCAMVISDKVFKKLLPWRKMQSFNLSTNFGIIKTCEETNGGRFALV